MLSLSLGPFALPVGPVLLLVASVLASLVAEWVARNRAKHAAVDGADRIQNDAEPAPAAAPAPRRIAAGDAITASVLLGLLAARLGHLALNWHAYADSPASVIDIRDGGWNLPIGVVAGLAWLLRLGWRTPTQRPALAAGAVVGLVIWGMGMLMQQRAAPAGYPQVALVALKDGQPATLAQAARGRPVVVNLWASWCGPCQAFAPTFSQAAAQLTGRCRLAKLDSEANPQLAGQLGIRSIPSLILFKNGREIARQSGALPLPQLKAWLHSQGLSV